jgi:hypothetical protein
MHHAFACVSDLSELDDRRRPRAGWKTMSSSAAGRLRRLRHTACSLTAQPINECNSIDMRGLSGKVALVNGVGPAAESGSIENIGTRVLHVESLLSRFRTEPSCDLRFRATPT